MCHVPPHLLTKFSLKSITWLEFKAFATISIVIKKQHVKNCYKDAEFSSISFNKSFECESL